MDIAMLAKLLKNPSDLPSAAKALGMQHATVPHGERTAEMMKQLEGAFGQLAEVALKPGSEVIALQGSPAALKGKTVRIIAVLEG